MSGLDDMTTAGEHAEHWSPPVLFWLPGFSRYEVVIRGGTLTFGYGPSLGLCKKTVPIDEITAVQTGTSTWQENLRSFGGWGIRYGQGTWCYNAANGSWVQFTCADTKKKYRFATRQPQEVAALLTQAQTQDTR